MSWCFAPRLETNRIRGDARFSRRTPPLFCDADDSFISCSHGWPVAFSADRVAGVPQRGAGHPECERLVMGSDAKPASTAPQILLMRSGSMSPSSVLHVMQKSFVFSKYRTTLFAASITLELGFMRYLDNVDTA